MELCKIDFSSAPCKIFVESRDFPLLLPHGCTSEQCVHLPYSESFDLSALARCFPLRPSLVLIDPKQLKVAESKYTDIVKDGSGAYTTTLRGVASLMGNYSFRIYGSDVLSAIEIIGMTYVLIMRDTLFSVTLIGKELMVCITQAGGENGTQEAPAPAIRRVTSPSVGLSGFQTSRS